MSPPTQKGTQVCSSKCKMLKKGTQKLGCASMKGLVKTVLFEKPNENANTVKALLATTLVNDQL